MLRETWWVSLAALLASLQGLFAVSVGGAFEVDGKTRATLLIAVAACAGLTLIGIMLRPRQRRLGDALIVVGVVPSALAGIAIYWFPPMWFIAVAGLAVINLATRDGLAHVDVVGP